MEWTPHRQSVDKGSPGTQIPESGFEIRDLLSTYYPLATVLGAVVNEMTSPCPCGADPLGQRGRGILHNSASEQKICSQGPRTWPVLSPPAVLG